MSAASLLPLAVACAGPSPRGAERTTTAATAWAPASTSSAAPGATPAPPEPTAPPEPAHVAALRARGFHRAPVFTGDRWCVFLGDAGSLTRMFVAPAASGEFTPVGAPVGARVVDAFVASGQLAILFESLPFHGQPSGLRYVGLLDPKTPDLRWDARLLGVSDRASAEGALARPPSSMTDDEAKAALARAASSREALVASLAAGGLPVVRPWGQFTEEVGRLTAATLAGSPWATELDRALRGAAAASCWRGSCPPFLLREEGGSPRLARLSLAPSPPPARGGAPRVVEPIQTEAVATALSRLTMRRVLRVSGAAPYDGDGGVLGVAALECPGGGDDTAIVVVERNAARLLALRTHSLMRTAALTPRFVDLDGDGYTDLIARVDGLRLDDKDKGKPASFLTGVRVPWAPSLDEAVEEDGPSVLAVVTSASLDAAVKAALAVEQRPVSKEEACALLSKIDGPAAFAAHAAKGAKIIEYGMRGAVASQRRVISAKTLSFPDLTVPIGNGCRIQCDPGRPYCVYPDEPDAVYFWLSRAGGRLLLSGIGVYRGS